MFSIGCATIKHGTTQPVSIDSYPAGATVRINGDVVGHTPLVVTRSRTEEGTGVVSVEQVGYEKKDQQLRQSLSGAFWANLLLGGVIGMGVDLITGAWANIQPHEMNFQLAQVSNSTPNLEVAPSNSKQIGVEIDKTKDRLDSLKKARDEEIITEQEYKAKRKAVVDAL